MAASPGVKLIISDRLRNPPEHQPIAPEPANAVDAGGSLAGFGLQTNARHQFVSESQMWKTTPFWRKRRYTPTPCCRTLKFAGDSLDANHSCMSALSLSSLEVRGR
jgi:hypothetical protein